MRALKHYWEPLPFEISGHSAMTMVHEDASQEFVAFWAIWPDKTGESARPSYFNRSFETDCWVIGLRSLMHAHFISQHIDPPSGIAIWLTFINALQSSSTIGEINTRLLNWKKEFHLEPSELSEHEQKQVDTFCSFLTEYLQTSSIANLLRSAMAAGAPTDSIEVNGLDTRAMSAHLRQLQATPENILWQAQVGSQTDRDLADPRGNRFNRFAFLPGTASVPGIKGHQKGKMRHNCSSLILALMQVGGIDTYLEGYKEKPAARLTEMIKMGTDAPDAKAAKLKKVNAIGYLPSFSMARYCGTTPHELYEMSKYAEDRRLHPPTKKGSSCCVM